MYIDFSQILSHNANSNKIKFGVKWFITGYILAFIGLVLIAVNEMSIRDKIILVIAPVAIVFISPGLFFIGKGVLEKNRKSGWGRLWCLLSIMYIIIALFFLLGSL